jgi:hypothetical protein
MIQLHPTHSSARGIEDRHHTKRGQRLVYPARSPNKNLAIALTPHTAIFESNAARQSQSILLQGA